MGHPWQDRAVGMQDLVFDARVLSLTQCEDRALRL